MLIERIGSAYILTVLGPSLTKILDSSESFDVETKKSEQANTDNLLNCLRAILQSVTSSDSIFLMPEEMK